MKTVVCFGDSNSYGTPPMPDIDFWGRYAPDERWPGVMGAALGADWRVIEEALPGRTTVHDDPIEGRDRNGLRALSIVLGSHRPIDLVILKLGTNDLKARFSVTPDDIAASVEVLVRTIRASEAGPASRPPAVAVIAPAPVIETNFAAWMFLGGAEKSRAFGRCFAAMAARLGVPLLDAGGIVQSDPLDGIHLSKDSHRALGQAAAAWVRSSGF